MTKNIPFKTKSFYNFALNTWMDTLFKLAKSPGKEIAN